MTRPDDAKSDDAKSNDTTADDRGSVMPGKDPGIGDKPHAASCISAAVCDRVAVFGRVKGSADPVGGAIQTP